MLARTATRGAGRDDPAGWRAFSLASGAVARACAEHRTLSLSECSAVERALAAKSKSGAAGAGCGAAATLALLTARTVHADHRAGRALHEIGLALQCAGMHAAAIVALHTATLNEAAPASLVRLDHSSRHAERPDTAKAAAPRSGAAGSGPIQPSTSTSADKGPHPSDGAELDRPSAAELAALPLRLPAATATSPANRPATDDHDEDDDGVWIAPEIDNTTLEHPNGADPPRSMSRVAMRAEARAARRASAADTTIATTARPIRAAVRMSTRRLRTDASSALRDTKHSSPGATPVPLPIPVPVPAPAPAAADDTTPSKARRITNTIAEPSSKTATAPRKLSPAPEPCQSRVLAGLLRAMRPSLDALPAVKYAADDPRIEPLARMCRVARHIGGLDAPNLPPDFHASNPSLLRHPTNPAHLIVLLRATNYTLGATGQYEFAPHNKARVIESRVFAGSLELARLAPRSGGPAADPVAAPHESAAELRNASEVVIDEPPTACEAVRGHEDGRLIYEPRSRRVFGVFSVFVEHRGTRGPSVAVVELSLGNDATGESEPVLGHAARGVVLRHDPDSAATPDLLPSIPQVCVRSCSCASILTRSHSCLCGLKKNWAPCCWKGGLYLVYSMHPIVLLHADVDTGLVRIVSVDACPLSNRWRGSSAWLRVPVGWVRKLPELRPEDAPTDMQDILDDRVFFIAIVHGSAAPLFHHRFVVMRLDAHPGGAMRPLSLRVTHYSPPWCFKTHSIEYTCGLAAGPGFEHLWISSSRRDAYCSLDAVDTRSLWERMLPAPAPPTIAELVRG